MLQKRAFGHRSRALLFALVLALLLLRSAPADAIDASAEKPAVPDIGSPVDKFAELSDKFMKQSLALSPSTASQAGYHKHLDEKTGKTIELDAILDDVSLSAVEHQRAFFLAWQERFHTQTPVHSLAPQDAADWHLIDDQIALALFDIDQVQSYHHNPLAPVELIGGSLFQPLTADYADKEVRVGHVLARISQIPRFLSQVEECLTDSDPVFIKGAIEANAGNIDLIEHTVLEEIPAGSKLKHEYEQVAPPAIASLQAFSKWLQDDLAKKPASKSWRLGGKFYARKFALVMETNLTPEQVLADAEAELLSVRSEMLTLALPLHKQMYPGHDEHDNLSNRDRENLIVGEVLKKISDDHPAREHLQQAIEADLEMIKEFIRTKNIVSLTTRQNLKVLPTPPFMRASYSVAGFHSAPPLEPQAEAQYWVTPIDKSASADKAESKLREYNNFALKWLTIHEALPGHYIQFEHLNNIQPERRRLVRSLYGNGAYIEGWAEYIAQVMMDQGFLDHDPRFRLVMRKIRLRVIGNAILDIKMQTMNMTDEQAMDLLTKTAFQTEAEAEGKLHRAKLTATQLPTYYVGLREWISFRKKYEAGLGPKFDLLKFHDLALDQGPLPVPIVERLLLP